jgi:hypothetical protein
MLPDTFALARKIQLVSVDRWSKYNTKMRHNGGGIVAVIE